MNAVGYIPSALTVAVAHSGRYAKHVLFSGELSGGGVLSKLHLDRRVGEEGTVHHHRVTA